MNSAEYLSNGFGGFLTYRIDETIAYVRAGGKGLLCAMALGEAVPSFLRDAEKERRIN